MLECTTPFAVNLVATFSDKHYVYMLMENVMGGELFTFLQSRTYPLSEASARFFAGCVILALEHFQERSLVFRDLKPEVRGVGDDMGCSRGQQGSAPVCVMESNKSANLCSFHIYLQNLLITETGYLKVADFGFAKKLWRGKTYTMCGTPDYMAPEVRGWLSEHCVTAWRLMSPPRPASPHLTSCPPPHPPQMISHTGHSRAVDIWALGVLIYEMVVGITPFYNPRNQIDTFRRIVQCALTIPPHVSPVCADLIRSLMIINPMKRLGMGQRGIQEIKDHAWFEGFDWEALVRDEM